MSKFKFTYALGNDSPFDDYVLDSMEVLTCPCCGSGFLRIGQLTFDSFGVHCVKCGLEMARSIPDENPKGKSMKELADEAMIKALKAWCQRDHNPGTCLVERIIEAGATVSDNWTLSEIRYSEKGTAR